MREGEEDGRPGETLVEVEFGLGEREGAGYVIKGKAIRPGWSDLML